MGFYFRKSINFGGLRFNFSKSGIGVSAGFKGFRIGSGPRGNYVHIGANGLYYRASLGGKKQKREVADGTPLVPYETQEELNFIKFESSEVSEIVDSSSVELLEEIQGKLRKIPFWPFGILLGIIHPALAVLAAVALYFIDRLRKTTILLYDIDEESETNIQNFYSSFNDIKNCNMVWHLQGKAQTSDYKRNAGAKALVTRKRINIMKKAPKYMKTNVSIPCIPVGRRRLYFFPDRIFIYEGNKIGTISYSSLQIEHHNQRFIEEEAVPRDGTIIDRTWKYVNKNGSPDKRYSNNRQLPILLYSEVLFSSSSGLYECIQLSRADAGLKLIDALNEFKKRNFIVDA